MGSREFMRRANILQLLRFSINFQRMMDSPITNNTEILIRVIPRDKSTLSPLHLATNHLINFCSILTGTLILMNNFMEILDLYLNLGDLMVLVFEFFVGEVGYVVFKLGELAVYSLHCLVVLAENRLLFGTGK